MGYPRGGNFVPENFVENDVYLSNASGNIAGDRRPLREELSDSFEKSRC